MSLETYYKVASADMVDVANKIRTKGGTSETLEWPDDWKDAIDAIPSGVNDNLCTIGMISALEVGTPGWYKKDSSTYEYKLVQSTNRIGINISTFGFEAGDVIDIRNYTDYKFAIGTNDVETSASGQLWISGGYQTAPYTLQQADLADMKCMMIARLDNANITANDLNVLNQIIKWKRPN